MGGAHPNRWAVHASVCAGHPRPLAREQRLNVKASADGDPAARVDPEQLIAATRAYGLACRPGRTF